MKIQTQRENAIGNRGRNWSEVAASQGVIEGMRSWTEARKNGSVQVSD